MIFFNPAISLICAFLYSFILSFSIFQWYFLIPLLFLIFSNRRSIFIILRKLLFLNMFIFTIFIFVYFESNFNEAFNIYLRANLIIFFNLLLFNNSKGLDIIRGFSILNFPKKFIATFYFSWKMIVSLKNDFLDIKNTLRTRNFTNKTEIFTYETYGNVFGLLFIKSIQKSQRLKESFELRGFDGDIYLNNSLITTKYDYILLLTVFFTLLTKVII